MPYRRFLFVSSLLVTAMVFPRWLAAQSQPATTTQPATAAPAVTSQPVTPSLPTIKAETRLVLVDTVVTDKKGNYIRDLTAKDFRVWEDNKEQPVTSFSAESDAAGPNAEQRKYLVLFFDNSTMNLSDQSRARDAALKFLDANGGANRYIALVDFGGTLRITANFTTDTARLKDLVRNLKFSSVSPTTPTPVSSPVPAPNVGIPQLTNAAADFGARTLLLALRNLAKGLTAVPGRKTLVLFSSGFPFNPADPIMLSELTAAIATCNRSNVAIYPIDVRGLVTPLGFSPQWRIFPDDPPAHLVTATLRLNADGVADDETAHLVLVQRGGSGGTGGGGGGGGGRGGAGGGTGGTGAAGGGRTGGGTGTGTGGSRSGSGTGGGTRGSGGATRGVGGDPSNPLPVAPYSSSRDLLPTISDATGNQQILYELAVGTGGFVIVNSNDLLGGLEKIANEQTQYYVLGYTPAVSEEGSCHTLRVKVNRGDTKVRSRTGYCNLKSNDLLAGKAVEKELQNQATGSQAGNIAATMLAPYFYTSPNTARVNLAIEIPSSTVKFEKVKGKQHAVINVLGLANRPDGTVAARFSDQVEFSFDGKDEVEAFNKKPYHYENQFEIASGNYNLTVVFSSGGESFGKMETPLMVSNYDAQQFAMSAVALSKELRPLSQAGTSLDAALLEDRTPLVAQGMQIVPAGSDRFKKSDLAVFYAEVYDPRLSGTNPPKLGIQMLVLDRKTREKKVDTGGPLPDAKAGEPLVPFGLRLPIDKLPPGSYELEVRAGDSTGKFTSVRTADFEIE